MKLLTEKEINDFLSNGFYKIEISDNEIIIFNQENVLHYYERIEFSNCIKLICRIYDKTTGDCIKSYNRNMEFQDLGRNLHYTPHNEIYNYYFLNSNENKEMRRLLFQYFNTKDDYLKIINRNYIYRYFLEVYKYHEESSIKEFSRVGKDDVFTDSTIVKYLVKFLNSFIDDPYLNTFLPKEICKYESSYGYGGSSKTEIEFEFDIEMTKMLIKNYNSKEHNKFLNI